MYILKDSNDRIRQVRFFIEFREPRHRREWQSLPNTLKASGTLLRLKLAGSYPVAVSDRLHALPRGVAGPKVRAPRRPTFRALPEVGPPMKAAAAGKSLKRRLVSAADWVRHGASEDVRVTAQSVERFLKFPRTLGPTWGRR